MGVMFKCPAVEIFEICYANIMYKLYCFESETSVRRSGSLGWAPVEAFCVNI